MCCYIAVIGRGRAARGMAPLAGDIASLVARHGQRLPLRVGTRASPLALVQTRAFIASLNQAYPALHEIGAFQEQAITTTGDRVQDRRLAEIGGKGLFAKEIHEALLDGRVAFAVHSLKDLETELPRGIVLGCTLAREDPRDVLILADEGAAHDPSDPYAALAAGAVVGTSSVRRQSQLSHARPDLRIATIRGNVQTRLAKLRTGDYAASMLALAGLRRLGMEHAASVVLDPESMVPAACQGIVGVTVRADDTDLRGLLAAIEDAGARAVSTAERAMLAALDGSCRTPIGGHATLLAGGELVLTGMVARADGSYLLKRALRGGVADATRIGEELGASLRADSPADIFG